MTAASQLESQLESQPGGGWAGHLLTSEFDNHNTSTPLSPRFFMVRTRARAAADG